MGVVVAARVVVVAGALAVAAIAAPALTAAPALAFAPARASTRQAGLPPARASAPARASTRQAGLPPTRPPSPGDARLQGRFLLAGHVTVAQHIAGEHAGENVLRTWTFTPLCPAGECPTVRLVRPRASGSDTLVLTRRAAGHYVGAGTFYAPVRCAGKTYSKGESVPFTITVTVTSAAMSSGVVVATRLIATYTNRSRTNLTPCVAFPGHDAASYHGHLVPAVLPAR